MHALTLTTALADPPRPSPCPQPNRDTVPINRAGHATQHVGGSPTVTHGQAVREWCTMLQRTFDVASPVERFRGFVTACHLALDDLPAHLHDALTRESIAAPDSRKRWDQAMGRFTPATIEAFAHGFAVFLDACHFLSPEQSYDSAGGPDIIGRVYMDLLSGRSHTWNDTAQYFTPWTVAYAMAQISGAGELEARFHAEVKRLLADDPVLQAMTLTASVTGQDAFWWCLSRAWPRLKAKIAPVTVCDPCVGSGILLLAHAACHPLWLAQIGYVQYSGWDIDPLCCEMARLNRRLYGIIPLRLEPVTRDALERRAETAGPWADAYQAVITAPPAQQENARAAVVAQINASRRQQLS